MRKTYRYWKEEKSGHQACPLLSLHYLRSWFAPFFPSNDLGSKLLALWRGTHDDTNMKILEEAGFIVGKRGLGSQAGLGLSLDPNK